MATITRHIYSEAERQLTYLLVIELLAHQFCFPVKWADTQDVILKDLRAERVVEIGPADTLVNMMKKTLQTGYKALDAALGLERELWSYKKQSDSLYYKSQPTIEPPVLHFRPSTSVVTEQSVQVAVVAPTSPVALVSEAPTTTTTTTTTSVSVPDRPVLASDTLRTIVAIALKKQWEDISMSQSIKQLCGGRSTVQNEIVGDLVKEFDSLPEQPEDMPLDELGPLLGSGVSSANGKLGPCSAGLVERFVSAKLPAGSGLAFVRQYLQTRWGFGEGLQSTALLRCVIQQPGIRLPGTKDVRSFLDGIAHRVLSDAGIDPETISAPVATATAVASAIPHEALQNLQKEQRMRDQKLLQLYAKRCSSNASEGGPIVENLDKTVNDLQQQLNVWVAEHGEMYNQWIAPKFDVRKARKYDSYWNWVIQDLFELLSKTFNIDSLRSIEELAERIALLEARATPRLLKVIQYMIRECKQSRVNAKVPAHLALLMQLRDTFERSINLPSTFRTSELSATPVVTVGQTGVIDYSEIPRPGGSKREQASQHISIGEMDTEVKYPTPIDVPSATSSVITTPEPPSVFDSVPLNSLSLDSFSDADTTRPRTSTAPSQTYSDPYCTEVPYIKSNRCGHWRRDDIITNGYLQWFQKSSTRGVSFDLRSVLVTGAGKNSIGAEIVRMLLAAGAKVLVTTSSYSPEVTGFYQKMYEVHGGRGSQLVVVPFNGGSQQDITRLVEYIYDRDDGLGWDPDHVIPFAAVKETGRPIDNIDPKSELAHRVMLTNVIRLLGSIKSQKERRRINTHPTQVILPLSPNHGILGQDGLYAESKIGLEGLLNKWWSEDWKDYLSLCGAIIGWTRGTGLMASNDILAAGVEDLDIRTFSRAEMALHILGLMEAPVACCCEVEPLLADLSGGMASNASLRDALDQIQEHVTSKSAIKRAITKDSDLDEQTVNGSSSAARPRKLNRRARAQFDVHRLPDFRTEVEPLTSRLQGMVDLDRVVVVVGFGETGPYGNSRTRWEMETNGTFSIDGCLEMAWIMSLIKYHTGRLQGKDYCGWVETSTGAPIADADVKTNYESYILEHTGVRVIERQEHDQEHPDQTRFLHEVMVTEDLEPFEVSMETAQDFKREHGDKVAVAESESGQFCVTLKAGATMMVPKATKFKHAIGAEIPKGWDPTVYGIPADIISQVDPVTLYALVSTVEAFLSAGITDPYELYQHVHFSDIGVCVGGGMGGVTSLHRMFKQRFLDRQVQKDVLAETFINTTSAWINMLLLGGSGPIKTPVGACATSLESVDTGFELIASGKAKACLVGGFDGLEQDVAAEFANMQATVNAENEKACGRPPKEMTRPTTSTRAGFVESEGCGVQLLTTARLAFDMGLPIQGIIALTHTACDKIGRSVPAPGSGLLTIASEKKAKFPAPLVNLAYRRRVLEMRKAQINQQHEAESLWLKERLQTSVDSTEFGADLAKSAQECQQEINASARRSLKEALNTYGNEFWKGDERISPLRGALAVWGLSVDDLNVASLHGTSTVKNDLNETTVVQQQLAHLSRSNGNVMPCVCQKSLVGHAKGAAGAFALNGCLQMLSSGIVPGNRNADNIDADLATSDFLFFPSRTLQTQGIKAFSVTSFGFGQKGAQVIGVHPKYLFATITEDEYDSYAQRVSGRMDRARKYLQEGFYGNSLVRLKDKAPYDDQGMARSLTDPTTRL